VVVAMSSLL